MSLRAALNGLLALGALAACGEAEPDAFTGYVEAEYVYVAAPDAGRLVSTPRVEGDWLEAGDLVAELDPEREQAAVREAERRLDQARAQAADLASGARPEEIAALEAQAREAQAAVALAKTERDRWAELKRKGVASSARWDQAESDYAAAKARLDRTADEIAVAKLGGRSRAIEAALAAEAAAAEALAQAEWRLAQRTIVAPMAGRIEQVYRRAGEYATPGEPITALLPEDRLKVRFYAPQHRLSALALGAEVEVTCDGCPAPIPAKLSFIAREASFTPPVIYSADVRDKLVFLIEARLPADAGLRPGQPVDVRLPSEAQS